MNLPPQSGDTDRSAARIANFDRLAPLYRWMEYFTFGPFLAQCRSTFLHQLTACHNALVLGDGDGRSTARLLAANPQVRVDAVDASPAMLDALTRRAGPNGGRVRTYCADIRHWQPANPPYDLVVTHFFLDCLTDEEVRSLALRLAASLTDGGQWIVSDFAVPQGRFGSMVAAPLIGVLYRSFGLLTGLNVRALPCHRAALSHAGLHLEKRRNLLWGLLFSEIWCHAGLPLP